MFRMLVGKKNEVFEKGPISFWFKEGEDFNQMNTLRIMRIIVGA